jgi:hypothetical protein
MHLTFVGREQHFSHADARRATLKWKTCNRRHTVARMRSATSAGGGRYPWAPLALEQMA